MALQKVGVKGRAAVRVIRNGVEREFVDERQKLRSGQFVDNLVLDSFFAYLAGTLNPSAQGIIKVGTGSTTPTVEQTQLVNWVNPTGGNVAGVFSSSYTEDAGILTYSAQYVATFPLGAVIGNLSEAGLIYANTSTNASVHTRLLFTDTEDEPTTIPVTSEDQLIITYIMDYVMAVESAPYNVSGFVDGIPTDISAVGQLHTFFALNIGNLFLLPGSLTASSGTTSFTARATIPTEPPGTSASYTGNFSVDYIQRLNVSGGKEADYTMGIGAGNISGGIASLTTAPTGAALYRWNFTPAFPKNADRQFKFTFRREWARL